MEIRSPSETFNADSTLERMKVKETYKIPILDKTLIYCRMDYKLMKRIEGLSCLEFFCSWPSKFSFITSIPGFQIGFWLRFLKNLIPQEIKDILELNCLIIEAKSIFENL